MTLEELKAYPKEVLTPKIAAEVLHCNPYSLNIRARDNPEKFEYPIEYDEKTGRLRIPKAGLINYLEGKLAHSGKEKAIGYESDFTPEEVVQIYNFIGYIKSQRRRIREKE